MAKPNGIITLTTDFGDADGFVGAMKGVILGIHPGAHLVDIAHNIPRHDVRAGALALARACPFFPPGTVHLVVVDPGVGSARKGILAETNRGLFVLPDNGLLSLIAKEDPLVSVHALENPAFQREEVSQTFHGRDIFAPAAAHAALGVPPSAFGLQLEEWKELEWPLWRKQAGKYFGKIIAFDTYGNAFTNLPNHLIQNATWRCSVQDYNLMGPVSSYAEADLGKPLFLEGSMGFLEVAVREGNAKSRLGLTVGTDICLEKIKTPL